MRPWALIITFALFLFGMLFALSAFVKGSGLGNEFGLPLLAIAGVMALLGSLAVVAVSFSLTSLSDRTQALGLPNGSVRAVIALSLIVLFAILTVYLFSTLHEGGPIRTVACLDEAHKAQLVGSLRPDQFLGAMESRASAGGLTCADAAQQPTLFIVYFRDIPDPASEDFAKQLLVLIGALVTTVSGFYFGSKATSDAQAAVGSSSREGPPAPVAVSPATIPPGGSDPVELVVTGRSLNSVREVRIVAGGRSYADAQVVSNPERIVAHLTVPTGERTGGLWDVVVTDGMGRQGRLRQAFAMGVSPASVGTVEPATLSAGEPHDVVLTGAGLAAATGVSLVAGPSRIDGKVTKAEPTQMVASFDVPSTAGPGYYDLVVAGPAGQIAARADAVQITAR